MQLMRRAPGTPAALGILPGSFNPPTRAHLALAEAALSAVDEVLFVLPQAFPHKTYEGVGSAERLQLLEVALRHSPRMSLGVSEGGLFIDIAREAREAYGPETRLAFICGRDAAERIVNWDYGEPGAFREMLDTFQLLVAQRQGTYEPPRELGDRIHVLPVSGDFEHVSASEVRHRIARGRPWEHLVPESITGLVREIYGRGAFPPA